MFLTIFLLKQKLEFSENDYTSEKNKLRVESSVLIFHKHVPRKNYQKKSLNYPVLRKFFNYSHNFSMYFLRKNIIFTMYFTRSKMFWLLSDQLRKGQKRHRRKYILCRLISNVFTDQLQ